MNTTVYAMAQNPRMEVNASAERFLMRLKGKRTVSVRTMMLEERKLRWAGRPAEARRGVNTSPRIPEYIMAQAVQRIAIMESTIYVVSLPIVRAHSP